MQRRLYKTLDNFEDLFLCTQQLGSELCLLRQLNLPFSLNRIHFKNRGLAIAQCKIYHQPKSWKEFLVESLTIFCHFIEVIFGWLRCKDLTSGWIKYLAWDQMKANVKLFCLNNKHKSSDESYYKGQNNWFCITIV